MLILVLVVVAEVLLLSAEERVGSGSVVTTLREAAEGRVEILVVLGEGSSIHTLEWIDITLN